MKALVTGGTGFIGKHLVESLLHRDWKVRCLVRRNSNCREIESLGVELACGDLLDRDSLDNVLPGIDTVFHLGGEVYAHNVKGYFRTNVQGTRNLLDACLSHRIGKFIYFSSIAAAGPNQDHTTFHSEEDRCHPITPYGQSKLEAECIVRDFYQNHGLATVILRLPVIYGPGQSADITKIFEMAGKGRFILFGNGENVKSVCYIKNLLYGIELLEHYQDGKGEIFYIADDTPYTLNKIIQTIADKKGVPLSCLHLSRLIAGTLWVFYRFFAALGISIMSLYMPMSMSLNFGCDISKIKKKLSYNPVVPFDDAIQETLIWLRESNS